MLLYYIQVRLVVIGLYVSTSVGCIVFVLYSSALDGDSILFQ